MTSICPLGVKFTLWEMVSLELYDKMQNWRGTEAHHDAMVEYEDHVLFRPERCHCPPPNVVRWTCLLLRY